MLKSNFINLLGILAALVLSSLLLARTAELPPAELEPENVVAADATPAAPIVIKSYPSDAVVIEALPAK
jgi:hypothetical protein